MNDYTKGILTGASLILCFFMFVSAKSQSKNLGDVTVTKLQVVDGRGNPAIGLGDISVGLSYLLDLKDYRMNFRMRK
ncbi:MAG TPA: hypothetical protein EYN68_01050 [Candidatus Marinimicrobia bacterium]|jgi:hypothetical protein|nr:hypothetical protein [Candidatus Neomarinimicrobiota bacterium]